ncbi:MAG: hypothetical protein II912_01940 [Clostridia bacterium]|nr:hypothetical protein [Clostridia bacterium]
MKKILAILLVMMLALISVAAYAADETTENTSTDPADYVVQANTSISGGQTAATTITISKKINVVSYDNTGKTPAQEISFSVGEGTFSGATTPQSIPVVTIDTLTLTEGKTEGDINIHLPAYTNIGTYTYNVTETASATGMVAATNLKLKITVTRQGEVITVSGIAFYQGDTKTDEIENVYQAGSLKVGKTVTGNMGDINQSFEVTVTFTGDANTKSTISYTDPDGVKSDLSFTNGTATKVFSFKHGQTVQFDNIPVGVTYTIHEEDYSGDYSSDATKGYDKVSDVSNKAISDSTLSNETITNHREVTIDTGVELETLPYVMIMVLALAGAALLLAHRRKEQ